MENTRFAALLTYLPESKGGRKIPASNGHRVVLRFSMIHGEAIASVSFKDVELAFGGDSVTATLTMHGTDASITLHAGLDFEFFETGKLQGHGTITELL